MLDNMLDKFAAMAGDAALRKVDPVKHEQKRGEILEAAIRCFIRDGFRGASTTDICVDAGISPGHLYYYFSSKDAIIEAMIEFGLKRSAERFKAILSATDVLEELLADIGDGLRFEPSQVLSLDSLAEAVRNPEFAKLYARHNATFRSLWADILRRGQDQGSVDPGLDVDATADILIAMIDGARALAVRNPKFDIKQHTAHLKTMLVRFLRPPQAKAAPVRHRPARTGRTQKRVKKS
jgi:TetR/AcrR family transcriptional regulator, repressor for uid operon